jgi:sugar phosphate isomerase/epimerase
MLYGGHVNNPEDIDFLRNAQFDFGEVVLRNAKSRSFWAESQVLNNLESGFFLIAHGPREGPANSLKHLREIYFTDLCETIDLAQIMGIHYLTVHLWMDPRFVWKFVRTEKKKVLRDVVDYAKARDVNIGLENLSETAADLAEAIQSVPLLGITLDVGHGQLLSETNTSFTIIEQLSEHVRHVHLHDNRGGQGVLDDLHLPIGEGIVDFQRILGALVERGYDGTMTFELKNHELLPARRIITKLLGKL